MESWPNDAEDKGPLKALSDKTGACWDRPNQLELQSKICNTQQSPEDKSRPMQSEEDLVGDTTTRLPATSEPSHYLSNLLEKTSDGIIKAARSGDIKMLKDLHGQGFSLLSIDSSGQTALHYGARYGHKDIVKYLIACAPISILNMADNDRGQTALHKAAASKRRSICCMLVAGGACLTVNDNQGNTPRLLALHAHDPELAAYLESQEQFQQMTDNIETVV